jgi:hypothetical protein
MASHSAPYTPACAYRETDGARVGDSVKARGRFSGSREKSFDGCKKSNGSIGGYRGGARRRFVGSELDEINFVSGTMRQNQVCNLKYEYLIKMRNFRYIILGWMQSQVWSILIMGASIPEAEPLFAEPRNHVQFL